MTENRFELVESEPIIEIVYQKSTSYLSDNYYDLIQDSSRDFDIDDFEDDCNDEDKYASLREEDIEVKIAKNSFSTFNTDTINYDIDKKYGSLFTLTKFTAYETSNIKPCDCPIPRPTFAVGDVGYAAGAPSEIIPHNVKPWFQNSDYNNEIIARSLNLQNCLSPLHPQILGKGRDICRGIYPTASEAIKPIDGQGNIANEKLTLEEIKTLKWRMKQLEEKNSLINIELKKANFEYLRHKTFIHHIRDLIKFFDV